MAAGLLAPDGGGIRVLGRELGRGLRGLRAQVGYMPQQYSLYADLTVQENLRFFAGMYGVQRKKMLECEERLLGIARLSEFRGRAAGALSGGMYKKLALACALIHSPRLLLLDEPTNGIDPISRRELWDFLKELLSEGVGVLISTPYMDEAERCDRVGLMVAGSLVALDRPSRLKEGFAATVLEVATEPPLAAAELFAAEPGVEQVYPVGRKLHIVTVNGAAYGGRVEEILRARGVRATAVAAVPPSFEDIFLGMSAAAARREADR
jgi:ABC-2 type transport system ATP-binding protein